MIKQEHIRNLLKSLLNALELSGPNFEDTPDRVARFFYILMHPDPVELTSFPIRTKSGMIVVKNHKTWSLCPHHLLPVEYTFKVAYLPRKKMFLGLSKPARLIEQVLATLPLQEEIPGLVGQALEDALEPMGIGVLVHGVHMCTRMRGVKSPCMEAVVDFLSGLVLHDSRAREEFLIL